MTFVCGVHEGKKNYDGITRRRDEAAAAPSLRRRRVRGLCFGLCRGAGDDADPVSGHPPSAAILLLVRAPSSFREAALLKELLRPHSRVKGHLKAALRHREPPGTTFRQVDGSVESTGFRSIAFCLKIFPLEQFTNS